jgi:hypothetical protein
VDGTFALQWDWISFLVFLFRILFFTGCLDWFLSDIGWSSSDIWIKKRYWINKQNCQYEAVQGTLFVQLTVKIDVTLVFEDMA